MILLARETWNTYFILFILLDSPIIGRVTETAWRQLLGAHNNPSPHERQTTTVA